jgi:hypothetical protein
MTRCPEGHFYDPAKHPACPWCALPTDAGRVDQKTRPMQAPIQGNVAPPPLPAVSAPHAAPPVLSSPPPALPPVNTRLASAPANPLPAPPSNPNATVRLGGSAKVGAKNDPVAGWLVCLEGPDRGRDFRLHMEKNFIGRAPNMDVVLDGDNTVSRERHAIVIFDPKKKTFWALPGDASGLVYLNGEIVNSPVQMKTDDILEVGLTKLVLIPFCGDRYSWSNDTASPVES